MVALTLSYFNCIVVSFFLFLTLVTLCAPPTALLSKPVGRIHARFVSHLSNDTDFVKVTLTEWCHYHMIVQVYKILHLFTLRICLSFLRMLLGVFLGTVIDCLFLE